MPGFGKSSHVHIYHSNYLYKKQSCRAVEFLIIMIDSEYVTRDLATYIFCTVHVAGKFQKVKFSKNISENDFENYFKTYTYLKVFYKNA